MPSESTHHHHERSQLLHEHHRDSSSRHLDEDVPLYAPPKQRQRWEDTQILPHVNWGDLFFDLFYVAAAHNLARILEVNPSIEGLFYFLCCYAPIFAAWSERVAYDSRFTPDDNFFHRGMEVFHLCVLGTLVQNIGSVEVMSHPSVYSNTMIFASAFFVDAVVSGEKHGDVVRNAIGGDEAKRHATDDRSRKRLVSAVYLVGALLAGYEYFFVSSGRANLLPMLIVLSGVLVEEFTNHYQTTVLVPKRGNFNEHRVPMNLEFMNHRLGEWIMLMLGESILSLLIVNQSQGLRYFVTFYAGILSVTMLQYIYFRTAPTDMDDHAMRRSANGGYFFYYMLMIYSATLIIVGGSYKLILIQYLDEQIMAQNPHAVISRCYTLGERRIRIGNMFCWSLGFSFLALDLMLVSHRGFAANRALAFKKDGSLDYLRIFAAVLNLSMLIITSLLSQWTQSLEALSVLGLILIVAQILTRTLKLKLFPISKSASVHQAQQWPNVTTPQIAED